MPPTQDGPATIWTPPPPGSGEMSNPGVTNITDTTGATITDTTGAAITDTGSLFTPSPATIWGQNDSE